MPGVWLGKRYLSDEHLVAVEGGSVCVTSAVRIMPDSESWDIDFVNKIRGVPWDPKDTESHSSEESNEKVEVIPADPALEPDHPERPQARSDCGVPRDFYVTKQHLRKYGYTASCTKCRSLRENFATTKGHSGQCRERLREAMRNDEGGKGDLERAEERQNKYLARELENQDRGAADRSSKRAKEESDAGGAPSASGSGAAEPHRGATSSGQASSSSTDQTRKRESDRGNEDVDGPAKARKSEEPPKVIAQPSVENRKRSREGDEGDEERLTRGDGDDNMDIGGVEDRGTRERSEKDHEEWTKRL